jgi:AcrR family transcriptional regulator
MQSATVDARGRPITATRRSNRRTQILRKTARLFLENGFDATSMGQIAHRNKISEPGLYYHFTSKQDLLAAIMHLALDHVDQLREEAIAHSQSHEDRLRRMIHEHVLGVTRADVAAFTILSVDEANALLPKDRREITLRKRAYFDFIRGTLDGLKAEGRLYDLDTTAAAFTLLGMVLWIAKWYRRGGRLTAEQVADEVTKQALQSVIRPE